ncbi:PREDICTED: uncharacterized protein At4g18490 isoform X2 [Tarenaya hassleriana]|uniref:uncharacterized protein At4g18490 isoform X2 n=1 Tax=Tarenaya hassleriana TaxID=28532 RepID=UPI00053C2D4E|nr:PREDICTED: uncharacterized protein At4g18490 isoform X2 [Tarenaya hassleriana]
MSLSRPHDYLLENFPGYFCICSFQGTYSPTLAMTAPAKGSSAGTQDKNPLLDKDMGKEFLSSWKTMSITEDDPMDFNFDLPANNKKNFNFEKLDMGFSLDGDFGKLSSFKVDMPDFDFSSPSKKTEKTKETSDDKPSGNSKQKKDLFSFSFDFNELDDFDIDSSLRKKGSDTSTKTMDRNEVPTERKMDDFDALEFDSDLLTNGQTTSVGSLDVRATASEKKEKHSSKTSDTVVSTKQAALESMESSMVGSPQSPETSNSKTDRICLELQSLCTSPDKTSCPMIEEIDEQRPLHETMAPLPSHTFEAALTAVAGETGPDVHEFCRSDAKEDSAGSPDQNAHDSTNCTLASSHEGIEPISSQLCTAEQDIIGHEQNEMGTDTVVKIMDQSRTILIDPDKGCSLTALSGKLPPETCVRQNVQMQDPCIKLLMAPSRRMLKLDDSKTTEKAGGLIRSRVFKRPDQPESQVLKTSPHRLEFPTSRSAKNAQTEFKYSKTLSNVSPKADHANTDSGRNVSNDSAKSSHGTKIRRDHLNPDTVTVGNETKLDDFSKLQDKSTTKERPIMQMGDKDSCSQVDASSPTEKTSKLLNSRTCLHKPEVSSLERLKVGKIASNVTGVKTLRNVGATKDQSDTTLHQQVNSSINKEQNMIHAPRKKSSEIHHSFARDKTPVLQLFSLKRKALDEDPNVGVSPLKPFKRVSASPGESRNPDKLLHRGDEGKFCSQDNKTESRTKNLTCNNSPERGLEARQQINLAELEIPVTENDDNVAKAEAYAKELENICNILRKKQEEAKELLVRAVVNNNNLLMLNHPLYEQKIRVVQKFAARLTSKELPMQFSQTMVT